MRSYPSFEQFPFVMSYSLMDFALTINVSSGQAESTLPSIYPPEPKISARQVMTDNSMHATANG